MGNPLKAAGQALLGIAPTLSKILLGPVGGALAGTALKAASSALGIGGKDQTAVARALALKLGDGLTPDQMSELRKADNDFTVRMKELDVDLEDLHRQDRASARRMQVKTKSWTVPALAFLVTMAFIGSLVGVFVLASGGAPLDPTVATLVGAVVGYVAACMNTLTAFYWGSSDGGDAASEHLADVAKGGRQ